eukprot:446214-Lingulodinium_polyedra.AAC.1
MKLECFCHGEAGKCGILVRGEGAWGTLNAEVLSFFRMAAAYKQADTKAELEHHWTAARALRA